MSDGEFVPSAYGYRVMKPKNRYQRRVAKDKVALEQNRISQRVGIEARMHQQNSHATSAGLTSCVNHGAGYLSNADRFHSDTAGEEFLVRQEETRKKNAAIAFRKRQAEERERARWEKQDNKLKQEEEYWEKLREDGCGSKKNQSLVAYDITSLQYSQSVAGEEAKYEDDMVRYRGQLRTHHLVTKGDSRASYNIISGNPRNAPPAPAPIDKPNFDKYNR